MEQSCYKCGARFEEGAAFCPQCNAPQIRVAIGDGVEEPGLIPAYRSASRPSGGIEWSQGFRAAALAGFVGAVALPFFRGMPFGTVVLAGTGFLAVAFYRRRRPLAQINPGIGARLGALGGGLGFAFLVIPVAIGIAVSHSWDQLHGEVLQAVKDAAARSPGPQAQQMIDFVNTPAGFALLVAGSLITFLLFAAVGGAIGGAILRRSRPPEIGRF